MSHWRTLKNVDEFGLNFDKKIKTWKNYLEHSNNLELTVSAIIAVDKDDFFGPVPDEGLCMRPEAIDDQLQLHLIPATTDLSQVKCCINQSVLKEKANLVKGNFNEAIVDEVIGKLNKSCSYISCEEDLKNVQKQIELSHAPGYQVIRDNVDMFVKIKHMSSTNQDSSIHWFNMNAVFN